MVGIIDALAQDIQHTPIDMRAHLALQLAIQSVRIFSLETTRAVHVQILLEFVCKTRTHSWDYLQTFSDFLHVSPPRIGLGPHAPEACVLPVYYGLF